MELLQLRYFYESAKNENFSKTASKFMVPTTSVSASIKRLESELNCQLFDRTTNRIYLNAKGQLLQKALCTVFQELDTVIDELSAHNNDSRAITILNKSMRRKTTELITEYSASHSNVNFKTVFTLDDDYQNYDIIIDDDKDTYDGYDRIELFNIRLRLKCSEKSALHKQKLSLNQLCNQSFVTMDPKGNMYKILQKVCNRAGFSPNISIVCNDIECYEKFIASGMGIGIARETDSQTDASYKICDIDVSDFHEHYTVYAYYKKKAYYGNVKNFVEFLKSKSI